MGDLSVFLEVRKCYRARGWMVHDKLLQKGSPLSVSGGSSPHPTPTCSVRNARRQRTDVSQCQRLVKRKEIVYLKVTQT